MAASNATSSKFALDPDVELSILRPESKHGFVAYFKLALPTQTAQRIFWSLSVSRRLHHSPPYHLLTAILLVASPSHGSMSMPAPSNSPLRNHGRRGGALVSPVWRQYTNGLVVSAETVDSGLDQDEPELGVFIFSVSFKVLADRDSLANQNVSDQLVVLVRS